MVHSRNMWALAIFAFFYVGFGIFITLNQEQIVYQPFAQDFEGCTAFDGARRETFNGTRMYVADGERGYVVLYHGNAGAACDRYFYAQEFRAAGYGYIIPEYAGYSNDPEPPTHERIKRDAENVVAYLREQSQGHVLVVGESIGTGVASYHANMAAPDALLLISPFSSLADVARERFWFYPTSLLVENAFDNVALLQDYARPITVIHGDADTLIPHKLGQTLFDSLGTAEKTFVSIRGAGHNDLFLFPETYNALRNFLVQ